jgi:ATP-dependent DNA ligase
VIYDDMGLAIFDAIHSKTRDHKVTLCGLDLLELDGVEVRTRALLERKKRLQTVVSKVRDGIYFNEHIEGDGGQIFEHACKLGCEGTVAKWKDLPYESGKSKRWLKIKNPDSPAMKKVRDENVLRDRSNWKDRDNRPVVVLGPSEMPPPR